MSWSPAELRAVSGLLADEIIVLAGDADYVGDENLTAILQRIAVHPDLGDLCREMVHRCAGPQPKESR